MGLLCMHPAGGLWGSHAFAMFSAHTLREKRGIPVVCVIWKLSKNWSIGCLLALYGSTVHPRCITWFSGLFSA